MAARRCEDVHQGARQSGDPPPVIVGTEYGRRYHARAQSLRRELQGWGRAVGDDRASGGHGEVTPTQGGGMLPLLGGVKCQRAAGVFFFGQCLHTLLSKV